MQDITNLARRKSLRYKRKDISVHICQGRRQFRYVELLNISQNGMLIRGRINLKLNSCIVSRISFDKNNVFEQKSTVVSKAKIKSAELQLAKKTWFFFAQDNSVYDYGLTFEGDSSAIQTFLLQSNIEKRLEHHRH